MKLCNEILVMPQSGTSFACALELGHAGLHVAGGTFQHITGQQMIDGGRLYEKHYVSVSWHTYRASSKDVGMDSAEWREALSVPREVS